MKDFTEKDNAALYFIRIYTMDKPKSPKDHTKKQKKHNGRQKETDPNFLLISKSSGRLFVLSIKETIIILLLKAAVITAVLYNYKSVTGLAIEVLISGEEFFYDLTARRAERASCSVFQHFVER